MLLSLSNVFHQLVRHVASLQLHTPQHAHGDLMLLSSTVFVSALYWSQVCWAVALSVICWTCATDKPTAPASTYALCFQVSSLPSFWLSIKSPHFVATVQPGSEGLAVQWQPYCVHRLHHISSLCNMDLPPADESMALCPSAAPCACPTPDALAAGGAPYGCYNPHQYHCTTDNPQNGLVYGPGISDAGACPPESPTAMTGECVFQSLLHHSAGHCLAQHLDLRV